MRITVCQLSHEREMLGRAWSALRDHATQQQSDLVLLPEFVFVEPVWQKEHFDATTWSAIEARSNAWLGRLAELDAAYVVGTRPVTLEGKHFNEGFLWSVEHGIVPLRRKYFLPDEPGFWESRWFTAGDVEFPKYAAGSLSFGLNICTELWALETYGAYASLGVGAILSPRGTPAASTSTWLSMGTVAAVRAGAFCLSSNRVHADGSAGGAGWIISPNGELLAKTTQQEPFCTLDVDLAEARTARETYPRYVFRACAAEGTRSDCGAGNDHDDK